MAIRVYNVIKALPLICIFFLALSSYQVIAQDQAEYPVIDIDNFASLEVIDTKQLNEANDGIYVLSDGSVLALSYFTKQISIRDLNTNLAYSLPIPFEYDRVKIDFSILFLIEYQGKLMAYDLEQRKTLYVINTGEGLYDTALSPNQKILATGHFNHIKLWYFPFLFPYKDLEYYEFQLDNMTFIDNEHLIISSFGVSSLNIKTGERIVLGDGEEIGYSSLVPSEGLVAFSEDSLGSFQVWSWESGKQIFFTMTWRIFRSSVALTPDGRTLIATSEEGLVAWDLHSQDQVIIDLLPVSRYSPKAIGLFVSPDGQFLIVRYDDLVYTLAVKE